MSSACSGITSTGAVSITITEQGKYTSLESFGTYICMAVPLQHHWMIYSYCVS